MSKPTFHPKADMMHGRIIDVNKTRGGLELPDGELKHVTTLMLVDAVGPDVKRCKVGDIIGYHKCNHLWLRDGTHVAFVKDEDVWMTVENLDRATYSLEGDERENGRPPQILAAH